MDQDTTTPTTPETPSNEAPVAHQVSKGLIVGILVFMTILITALYVAFPDGQTPMTPKEAVPATSTAETDAAVAALATQGTSDELPAIEADLNTTDFNALVDIDRI